jgi:hypothetical protein
VGGREREREIESENSVGRNLHQVMGILVAQIRLLASRFSRTCICLETQRKVAEPAWNEESDHRRKFYGRKRDGERPPGNRWITGFAHRQRDVGIDGDVKETRER